MQAGLRTPGQTAATAPLRMVDTALDIHVDTAEGLQCLFLCLRCGAKNTALTYGTFQYFKCGPHNII